MSASVLPKGWKTVRLGEVADILGGGTPDSGNAAYWNGDINWFTPTEVKQKYLAGSQRKITRLGLQASSAKLLPAGALLVTTRATIGDVGIATQECATNQGFQSLVVKPPHIKEFWYYWLKHNKHLLLRLASGSTFLEVGRRSIAKILAMCPPIKEQRAIASVLQVWDTAIEKTEALVSAKERHFRCLMFDLMDRASRQSRQVKIKDAFSLLKGKGLSKDAVEKNGYRQCILYGELYTAYSEIISEVVSRTNSSDGTLSAFGDVLVPSSTTTKAEDLANATALLESGVLLGGDIIVLRPKDKSLLNSEYFAYYLTHFKRADIARKAQGITIIHLYATHIEDMEIDIPSLSEQEGVARCLRACRQEIDLLKSLTARYRKQKKILLNKLLSGAWRVK